MIIGNLQDTKELELLHPLLSQAFEWLKKNYTTVHQIGLDQIVIIPDQLYVNIETVELKEPTEQLVEAHKKYLDIHVPVDKPETIGWKSVYTLGDPTIPYNEDRDIEFYCTTPSVFATINPGDFCIMMPSDGHIPNIGDGKLNKLCLKLRLQ